MTFVTQDVDVFNASLLSSSTPSRELRPCIHLIRLPSFLRHPTIHQLLVFPPELLHLRLRHVQLNRQRQRLIMYFLSPDLLATALHYHPLSPRLSRSNHKVLTSNSLLFPFNSSSRSLSFIPKLAFSLASSPRRCLSSLEASCSVAYSEFSAARRVSSALRLRCASRRFWRTRAAGVSDDEVGVPPAW